MMINPWRELLTSASFANGGTVKPTNQAGHIRISLDAVDGYQWGRAPELARSFAIAAGLVEPTDEERAQMELRRAEYERREAERKARLDAAHAALAALTDSLARAVLDLHERDEYGECLGCDMDGYEAERPDWPCRTVVAVAEHYGIELPDA